MLKSRVVIVALVGTGALAAAAPAAAECARGPFTVNMPAGRLDTRLQDIAHKTGCALDVDLGQLRGKRAPRLHGRYTGAQMLNLSLMRSGFVSTWKDGRWAIVRHGDDALPAPATTDRRD